MAEECNEYVVDDGSRIRIKTTIVKVSKTTKFDKDRDPIFLEQTNFTEIRPLNPSF